MRKQRSHARGMKPKQVHAQRDVRHEVIPRVATTPAGFVEPVASRPGRRTFVKQLGATAAALGVPAWLGGSIAAAASRAGRKNGAGNRESRTLFFNFSHLGPADTTHHLYMGGRKYPLTRVADAPEVLAKARAGNAFLQAVPDGHITHHVEGVEASTDAVTLAYVASNENPSAGTWEMTSMYFNIPTPGFTHAYGNARLLVPEGPLPLSGKRRKYGVRPAMCEQDLIEESVLVDSNSHAEALVGLHPDVLSIESGSGAHIQTNYVAPDANTQFLAGMLETMGPAAPEGVTNLNGAPGWATLIPLTDDQTQQPYKKSDGKLNQYYPDWSPTVDSFASTALGTVHPQVKDDPTLGVDVTAYNLNDDDNQPPPDVITGKVWGRRDGVPTVAQSLTATTGSGPAVTFLNKSVETGLYVTNPTVQTLGDGRVQVTLDNVSNWFLRYLGLWVQFLGPTGKVIPLSEVENDTFPSEPGPYPRAGIDKADAMFLGVVSPAIAIAGIPVYPGSFAPTINIPKAAQTMKILYAGLGQSGSIPDDPADIIIPGIVMTAAFNYGVVGLFMAAGASTYSAVFKLVVSIGGGAVATAITSLIGGLINHANFARGMLSFSMGFLKVLFQTGLQRVITLIVEAIAEQLAAAEIIDSVPVAGQIARAVAAAVGGIQLAETSIEVAVSPAVYTFEVVETHDLSINIQPDALDNTFPPPPPGFTLYYKVSYLFDNGTAHVMDDVDVSNPAAHPIPITFHGIPRGGQVNVSIGFYMRRDTTPIGMNDWCAGFATTGLVPNLDDSLPDLAITETKVPIQSTTQYLHTRKITLDADGSHRWTSDAQAPPYVPPPDGQVPGLGDFNSITVRQGTSNPPQAGYVGYAWKAFSSGVNGCSGQAPGQFDQMANLNTDFGNNGANAQSGYVNTMHLCGYQPGVRMGYNLLTHNALNMYLDTTSLKVRSVSLDPPGFAGPSSGQAFALLNMDSTRCLLHPAGHIVSISNANHKIEALKLPQTAQPDSVIESQYLARTFSGQGTRPGLITSPVAAVISPDGTILVLEAGNNRIQAFDLGGNPVQFFKKQPIPYFLELQATSGFTYLDVAIEFTGYLYVLSKDAGNNHRLDIYHPTQDGPTPVCTTQGVNAAKLAVDFWRRVYTLNYEVLQLPGNGGIPSFTEPSVSQWLPTPPEDDAVEQDRPRFCGNLVCVRH